VQHGQKCPRKKSIWKVHSDKSWNFTCSMVSREDRLTPVAKNDSRALAQVTRSPAVSAARWHSPGAGSDVVSSSICCSILHRQHNLLSVFQRHCLTDRPCGWETKRTSACNKYPAFKKSFCTASTISFQCFNATAWQTDRVVGRQKGHRHVTNIQLSKSHASITSNCFSRETFWKAA